MLLLRRPRLISRKPAARSSTIPGQAPSDPPEHLSADGCDGWNLFAERIADRYLVVDQGRCVLEGPRAAIDRDRILSQLHV